MKVLVADDEPGLRRLLERFLLKWGYEPVLAENGDAAWQRFQEERFSLVIADWMMPEMEGPELVRRIRLRTEKEQYVYLILLTARTDREDLVRGMEAGADDFIAKPFDVEELRVRLRAGERILRLERALAEQNRLLRRNQEELEARVRERTDDLARAQERLLQAESEKKRFYGEVIRAVTQDRFHLVDAADLPTEGRQVLEMGVEGAEEYAALRKRLQALAEDCGMEPERADELVLATGEAATNAIKHAEGLRCAVFLTPDRVVTRVSDRGSGIRPENLPASILTPGFSTQVSLGMGYTMMLHLVDRVWLATGPTGTTVQLEKWIRARDREEAPLLALLDRF